MEDKEPNKKATAVFQESVDQVGSQACISQNSMVSSNINKQKQTLRPFAYMGRVKLYDKPGGKYLVPMGQVCNSVTLIVPH